MSARLTLAFDGADLPDGRIAVFGPRAGADLSALPGPRVQVIQGFKPDHDAFAAAGYDTATEATGEYAVAIVCVPRAKAEARAMIAEAMARTGGGPVWIDGQKEDGVESLLRDCRKRSETTAPLSKAHGKLFRITGGDFSDWASKPGALDGFVTAPGVFSADGIDPGSAALAAALPDVLPKRVVDLGAGWGYLSSAVLARRGVAEVHLVEADHRALTCARQNVSDPRAVVHWADALAFTIDPPVDAVVMNPPFHQGRSVDTGLGRGFIAAAARLLKPSGRLWLVANRHLPYEAEARAHFREGQEIDGTSRYKILVAARSNPTGARRQR